MSHDVVKSVGRVIDVLELFSDRRESLTASEICVALGYPNSSADALLKSLVNLGYLSLDTQTRRYFPSLRVTRLGEWIPAHLFTGETLMLLSSLHDITGETVTLSTQNDLNMQFIRVLPGTFPISLTITEGYMGPMFGSAVGTAFLSTLTDKQITRLLQRAKRSPKSVSKTIKLGDVIEEVASTREQGYAVGYDRLLPDTGAVAMPLSMHPGVVVGIGGLSSRIHRSEKSIIRHMRGAIRAFEKSTKRRRA